MFIITVRLWEFFKRSLCAILQVVTSNSPFLQGRKSDRGSCPHSHLRRQETNNLPVPLGGIEMSDPISHITGNWPIVAAGISGLALLIGAVRYKIPELCRKVAAMEKIKHPSTKDIEVAIDSMRTVCKFNQVSCQKGVECELNRVRADLDEKLSSLYDLVNKQAIIIARVDERVANIHERHNPAFQLPQRVVNAK